MLPTYLDNESFSFFPPRSKIIFSTVSGFKFLTSKEYSLLDGSPSSIKHVEKRAST